MRIFVFLALVVASLLLVPGAAAQANGTQNTTGTYVADGLDLLDSGYDNETGEAYVVLRSDRPQAVTVSDGGSLNKGSGPISTTTAKVHGRTRIEVGATNVNGRVAVVIDHDEGLYGHLVRNQTQQDDALIGGPWTARDVQVSAGAGALTVALFVIIQLVRYKRGTTHEPERIA